MRIPFQTVAVGVVVTIAHLVVIAAMKPASLQASKYFQQWELESFVAEALVKPGAEEAVAAAGSLPESNPGSEVADGGEIAGPPREEMAPVRSEGDTGELPGVPGQFLDLEKEMDSMKAVTDVRAFSGRIEEPQLEENITPHPVTNASVETPGRKTAQDPGPAVAQKSVKTGPFELREIRPVAR